MLALGLIPNPRLSQLQLPTSAEYRRWRNRVNHLWGVPLRHSYTFCRHPAALSTERGIFNGDIKLSHHYPSTEEGKFEFAATLTRGLENGLFNSRMRIISTGFLRSDEGSIIAADTFGVPRETILRMSEFGERSVGWLEGKSYDWISGLFRKKGETRDIKQEARYSRLKHILATTEVGGLVGSLLFNVEPSRHVCERVTRGIMKLEQLEPAGQEFLIVGHQFSTLIALTALTPFPPAYHWNNWHMKPAEITPFTERHALVRFAPYLLQDQPRLAA